MNRESDMELSAYKNSSELVFRVMFSLIFIVGGLGHFGQHEHMLGRLQASPWLDLVLSIGSPSLLLKLSGVALVIGGLSLLSGLYTRLSALVLFLTLTPITFVIHIAPDHTGPLLKNIAILGGLIHFFFNGPGHYSLDRHIDNINCR